MFPQDGVLGGTPKPIKDKAASKPIRVAIKNVALTTIGPIEFGRKCLNIIRQTLQPDNVAANTKSCSHKFKKIPLTNLVTPDNPVSTIIPISTQTDFVSKNALRIMINSNIVKFIITSTVRIITESTHPP